jgi:hypothetical protein
MKKVKKIKLPNGGELWEYPNGSKEWCLNRQLHRLDGPAVEYADGEKQWWIYDKRIPCETQEEFERLMRLKAFW